MRKWLVMAGLIALPGTALAQSAQCVVPDRIVRPQIEGPSEKEPKRVLPIGSYTLALSWSPQYCATARGAGSAFQCSGRFGFTLHGLWPDGYGKAWPQYCRPTGLVPRAVIRQNLCATPSVQLIQHEWEKHGTCMAAKPKPYFDLARAFYQSIRYPDMAALARQDILTVGQFADAFARANPGLTADMLRVTTTRDNALSEVWLCMDRAMAFARCPAHQGGAANASSLRIAAGPVIPNPRRPLPRVVRPTSRPGLMLDLASPSQTPPDAASE